jgi:hypothetical protein
VITSTFVVTNLNQYLLLSENAAVDITTQLLLNNFPNSQIDLFAPPAYVIFNKLAPPPDAKLISSLPVRDVLLQVFYHSLGSYLVAVNEALKTEEQQEIQKFASSASRRGLQIARQALSDALCSTKRLLANANCSVPKSTTDSLLQLSWYQFPINTSTGRFQNHVRQYSLAKGLQAMAATLRSFVKDNATKLSGLMN